MAGATPDPQLPSQRQSTAAASWPVLGICDGVQIHVLSDSDNFLQIRNPTDFPTHLRPPYHTKVNNYAQ